jgi:hypothetical protein
MHADMLALFFQKELFVTGGETQNYLPLRRRKFRVEAGVCG